MYSLSLNICFCFVFFHFQTDILLCMLMSMITFGLVSIVVTGMFYLTESNGFFMGGQVSRYWIETFLGVFLGIVVKWIKFLLTLFLHAGESEWLKLWKESETENDMTTWSHWKISSRSSLLTIPVTNPNDCRYEYDSSKQVLLCCTLLCDFLHVHVHLELACFMFSHMISHRSRTNVVMTTSLSFICDYATF